MKTTCWISMIIFKESTTDKIDDALDELGDDFTEEEVRWYASSLFQRWQIDWL